MSVLTREGRKRLRDHQRDRMKRELRKDPELGGVPAHQLDTLSELKLVGRTRYGDIKKRGAVLADGAINPSVEVHRKNAHEQLCFFSAIADLKRAQIPEPTDIVALMEGAAESVEPEQAADPPASDN